MVASWLRDFLPDAGAAASDQAAHDAGVSFGSQPCA